jgi:pimeloyl-ACP methyl ester carboxylesterase
MTFFSFVKGAAITAAACVTIAALSGAAFEKVSRDRSHRNYPAPGRLVNVNGRNIQLDCRGTGSPTVVFESGLDYLGSLSWTSVQDSIAATTRACSYSRAGVMWSDPATEPFDADANASTLHAVLAAAGEAGPYVLVAHSLGGPYIAVFTQRYPADVAGLVMVDASHPDQFAAFEKATGKTLMPTPTVPRIGATLAWSGLTRILGKVPLPATWPPVVGEVAPAFLPTSINALANETAAIPKTLARGGRARDLGDRPLIVLSVNDPKSADELKMMDISAEQGARLEQAHRDLAADMSRWSTRGKLQMVDRSSHYIQFERPDAVIAAVREVVGLTQSLKRTPAPGTSPSPSPSPEQR